MTTKDKVVAMFHKTAATRQLNAKILQKRAEFAKSAAAGRLYGKVMQKRAALRGSPSEAYMAGFCKAAEIHGVDPEMLVKTASGLGLLRGGGKAVANGLKNISEGLVHGTAEAIPGVARGAGNVIAGSIAGLGSGATATIGGLAHGAAEAIPGVARGAGNIYGLLRGLARRSAEGARTAAKKIRGPKRVTGGRPLHPPFRNTPPEDIVIRRR